MKSMTGFARARKSFDGGSVEVTLGSINKRGQEIFVATPRELGGLEGKLYARMKTEFERGKVQLAVRLELKKTSGAVEKKIAEAKKICKGLKVPFAPDANAVLALLREGGNAGFDEKKVEAATLEAVTIAIAECRKTQLKEGAHLQKDFRARLKTIRELLARAEKLSGQTVALQRERLMKNLEQAGLAVETKDERVLKELALFADRVDIAEEITRLRGHLKAMDGLLAAKGSVGRQIEFLLQEFLREWNTLGNKSTQLELVQTALSAKNEVERLREQAANVE